MSAGDRAVIDPSRRLPGGWTLPSTADGSAVRLRPPGRRAPLLVLAHAPGCPACDDFVRGLAAGVDSLREWDGYPLVVRPGTGARASREPGAVAEVEDAGERLAEALSVRAPAVVIADQWGEVYLRHEAGAEHAFPAVSELAEWLRFLAIQCPECQGEAS
jgi:hypothetical protein